MIKSPVFSRTFFIHTASKQTPFRFHLFLFFATLSLFSTTTSTALPSHPLRDEVEKLDDASCPGGFSFAVMADSHNSAATMERIIDKLLELKPGFAVTAGDFTRDGKPEEYEQFLSLIPRAGIPWFTAPGNHEYRTPDGHTSPDGPKRYEKIFGRRDLFFDHCGWRFVILDAVAYDTLLPAQLKKLESALEGREGRSAVFMHYPPSIIEHWEDGIFKSSAERFMRILETRAVPYFFSGHIHIHDEKIIGPTTYIITGGAGDGLMDDYIPPENFNSPSGGAFHHFILVTIDENGVATHQVVKVDPEK